MKNVNKSKSNETRATTAIRMINGGKTWEDVSEYLGISIPYIQKLTREHYTRPKNYNNLLKKARENKSKQKKVAEILPEPSEEVFVADTGYLMVVGPSVLNQVAPLYIPMFCLYELEKLSMTYEIAKDILLAIHSTSSIQIINLRGREVLFEEPSTPVKDRTKGVVATATHLWSLFPHVRILTNSREVEILANEQNCGINVTYVRRVS